MRYIIMNIDTAKEVTYITTKLDHLGIDQARIPELSGVITAHFDTLQTGQGDDTRVKKALLLERLHELVAIAQQATNELSQQYQHKLAGL